MFTQVCEDVVDRLQASLHQFSTVSRTRDMRAITYGKGIAFVSMYATYEFAVSSAVRAAVDAVNQSQVELRNVKSSFLSLALDEQLNSFKDAGRKRHWRTDGDAARRTENATSTGTSKIIANYC